MLKINFCFIFVCVLIGVATFGCSNQKIEFKRESAFQNTMSGFGSNDKSTIKKNKNIYIYTYKDNEKKYKTKIKFGPKDIDFNLPIK